MTAQARRTEKLDLRVTPEAKRKISAAAAVAHSSVDDFIIESALDRADAALLERRLLLFDDEQLGALRAALDAPPRVLPELQRLLERKAPWE